MDTTPWEFPNPPVLAKGAFGRFGLEAGDQAVAGPLTEAQKLLSRSLQEDANPVRSSSGVSSQGAEEAREDVDTPGPFQDKMIALAPDLSLSDDKRISVVNMLKLAGGKVIPKGEESWRLRDCDILITKYRAGPLYLEVCGLIITIKPHRCILFRQANP